jgi:hypothetical protein
MVGSRNWLPRQVNCWFLLVLVLISPVSALAQSESADSAGSPARQAGSNPSSIDDLLNMDIGIPDRVATGGCPPEAPTDPNVRN